MIILMSVSFVVIIPVAFLIYRCLKYKTDHMELYKRIKVNISLVVKRKSLHGFKNLNHTLFTQV